MQSIWVKVNDFRALSLTRYDSTDHLRPIRICSSLLAQRLRRAQIWLPLQSYRYAQISRLTMWQDLTDPNQLDQLTQASDVKAQILFKHSTRCSISRVALSRFDLQPASQEQGDFYLLDLLQYRPISQQISERFDIPHESPQVLIVKNGVCIYHANHLDIEPDELYAQLNKTD